MFSSYTCSFSVTEFAHLLRMFSPFYSYFKNLQIRNNDISHALTINQEIFFWLILVFLAFSLVFWFCLSVFWSLLYLILSLVSVLYRNCHGISNKRRAISCHSLISTWECKQTCLLLNFVPTIDFASSHSSRIKSDNYKILINVAFNICNVGDFHCL